MLKNVAQIRTIRKDLPSAFIYTVRKKNKQKNNSQGINNCGDLDGNTVTSNSVCWLKLGKVELIVRI